jgi:hypothetical protein
VAPASISGSVETHPKTKPAATSKPRFTLARIYATRVSGVTFKNEDGSDRQAIITKCRPGEELSLIRDPANEFDSGAVKVLRGTGEQIGFLPAHMTRDGDPNGLARKIDSGTNYRCRVIEITGGGADLHYGINIEITDGDWAKREETAEPETSGGLWLLLLVVSVILAAIWLWRNT